MEISTEQVATGVKEGAGFLKGYPILGMLILALIGGFFLLKDDFNQRDLRLKAVQEKVDILEEAVKDYRQNTIISNQLSGATKKINENLNYEKH